jgi:hypothetical protein
MGSAAGWMVVEAIGRPIGRSINKGAPLAVSIGAVLGAVIPAGICFWLKVGNIGFYLGFGLLGGIVGSVVAAKLFPRAATAPVDYPWIGEVVTAWETTIPSKTSTSHIFYALTERAFIRFFKEVSVTDSVPSWSDEVGRLEKGETLESPVFEVHALKDLHAAELHGEDRYLTLIWQTANGTIQSGVDFVDVAHRAAFLSVLSGTVDKEFKESEREMTFSEATFWPFIFLAIALVLFGGLAWLSYYWTHHPPQPPRNKPKGDELVLLLTWAGPLRVALAGAIPVGGLLAWLMKRIAFRPLVKVLTLKKSAD